MKPTHLLRTFAALAAVTLINFSNSARAGNTWDGGGGDNFWGTGANWNADGAPAYGTISFSGTTRVANTNNSITAMNQVNWNGTAAWVMGGTTTLSVYDFGGTQAKLESLGSGGVTIDAPITFAANNTSPPNPFGEINAVGSDLLFSGNTVTVNGSSCNGIKFWGTNLVTFNNTVSASDKWFGMTTGSGAKATIGGSFTSGDFYVMNGGTLNLASGGSFTTSAVRLGGDFGNTGNQDQTRGGTFNLTSVTGGQNFPGVINSVTANTSTNLVVNSANTSGTNILSGGIFLDSGLRFTNAAGGTLSLSGTTDVKAQQIVFSPSGTITTGPLISSFGTGTLLLNGSGTLQLTNLANTYTGTNSGSLNAAGTQITNSGTLAISGDGSLGLAPAGSYNNLQFTGSGTLRAANTISLAATRNVSVASGATASLDSGGNIFTVNGVINGAGNLTKTGNGTLVLNSNNTFTGGAAINAGTLRVAGQTGAGSGTGTGAVFVNSGVLGGNGRIAGAVTVANNPTAMLYPNSGTTLTISNDVTLNGTNSVAKFDLSSATNGANDKVVLVNNTLTCGGAQVTVNLTNATLPTTDYVLFDVGASGTISGSFNATPLWSGTTPKYSSGYGIVTVGKTVVLRYTPIAITVTAAANTKTYDGTNTAAATPTVTSGSLESGDTGNFTEVYDNRNAGAGKTLTPSGNITAAGPVDVTARYNLTFAAAATGTINASLITVTAATDSKSYDGTTNSTGTPTITTGALVGGDTATWTQTFDSPNVGSRTLTPAGTVSDGNSGTNYAVTFATASGSITAAGTTLGLTSSTNLSQLNSNVTFTATVTPATASGDVVFKNGAAPFGTNALTGGVASFTTSTLPGGTNIISAEYAGDGNYSASTNSLLQIVNRPPAASNLATNVVAAGSVTIDPQPTDADGDTVTIVSVNPAATTNGGTIVIVGGTNLIYTATNGWSGMDSFDYTVSDERGGSATATVTVTVTAAAGPAEITGIVASGGTAIITAQGTAGAAYALQHTDGFSPLNWQDTGVTNIANGSGVVALTNAPAPFPLRFYRTKYVGGP